MKLFGCRKVQGRPESRTARSERMWYLATALSSLPLGAALHGRIAHQLEAPLQALIAAQQEDRADALQRCAQALGVIEIALCSLDPVGQAVVRAGPHETADVRAQLEQTVDDAAAGVARRARDENHAGKTAIVAVNPCRKLRPPTGPISPAQKKPAVGAPSVSSSAEASWSGTSNMCEPRPLQVKSSAPAAPSEPRACAWARSASRRSSSADAASLTCRRTVCPMRTGSPIAIAPDSRSAPMIGRTRKSPRW